MVYSLSQGQIKGSVSLTHRRHERSFQSHLVLVDRIDGCLRDSELSIGTSDRRHVHHLPVDGNLSERQTGQISFLFLNVAVEVETHLGRSENLLDGCRDFWSNAIARNQSDRPCRSGCSRIAPQLGSKKVFDHRRGLEQSKTVIGSITGSHG